jgi:mucin-19
MIRTLEKRVSGLLFVVLLALLTPLCSFAAERDFAVRYTSNSTGDIYQIGNTAMTCNGGCTQQNGTGDNGTANMVYTNGTGYSLTQQSSSATLAMPAGSSVLWAGLYWQADSNAANRNTVTLTTPTGTSALTSAEVGSIAGQGCGGNCTTIERYGAFVDVTSQVQAGGNGNYTVSNIVGSPGNQNTYAGWGLVVVFKNATLPLRNLTVYDGYRQITTDTQGNPSPNPNIYIPVSGFITPYTGPVNTVIGVIAGEGDRGNTGDNFYLNGVALTDAYHAGNDFFSSNITNLGALVTAKSPNYSNQMGWDMARMNASNILGNGATSATINLNTGGDWYYASAVTFMTDLYVPIITPNVSKTASDVNGGYLLPGDTLRFTINLGNTGYDTATNVILTDNIPTWTTYKPNSLQILSGANAGAMSDTSLNDQAEYIGTGTPRVVFRLGTGANGTQGGTLLQNQFTSISFDVTIDANIPGGTTITNTAGISNNGQTIAATNYSSASNPVQVGVLTPPTVLKSFGPNPVDVGGVSTMTIQLSNPAANVAVLTGVSFNDVYPPGMINDLSPNPTISCTAGSTPGSLVGGVAGANSIGMTNATIAQNGSCTVTARIKSSVAAQGNYTNNTGSITTSNAGTGPGASATFSVGGPTVATSFTPSLILQGANSTVSYTVSNPTSVVLTGAALSDALPSGMQVAAGTVTNSCGGTVTAALGSSSIALSGGSVPAASGGIPGVCTITVPVTTTAAGYFSNSSTGVSTTQTPTPGPDSAIANLTVIAKVTAAKSFAPTSITRGTGVSQLSITVTNPNASNPLNNSTVTGVQFTDSYPTNLVNSSAPNPVVSCSAGSSATLVGGVAGGTTIGLSAGSLAPGGSCSVTVNVTSATANNYTNSTGAIATTNAGSGTAATAVLNVSALTAPTASKSFSAGTIQVGGTSTMSIVLGNSNASSSITGVAFSDNYPTGLFNSATPAFTNSCGGTLTAAANGSSLSLTGGTIPISGTCTISAQVKTTSAGGFTNIIPTVTTANAGSAAQESATLNVMGPPVISKSFTPTAVRTWDNNSTGTSYYSTLTITVTNPGANPLTLTGVSFTDTYPTNVINYRTPNPAVTCSTGSSATVSGGTARGNTIGMTGGTIVPGGNCVVTVRVSSNTAGTYTNTIGNASFGNGNVTSTNGGPGNIASDILSVGHIGITKSFAAPIIASGDTTVMTVVLTNGTGAAITNAAFTDTYPAGMTNAAPSNPVMVCTSGTQTGTLSAPAGGNTLSLTSGSRILASGGTCTITVNVTSSASVTNTVPVGAFTGGTESNLEAASASLAVYPTPTATMSFSPPSIAYNQAGLPTSSLLTVTLFNPNNFIATGVAFSDSYPGSLVNAAVPGAVSSCGGTVIAAANGSTLALSGASIPANGSCSVTVNVTSASAGNFNNSTGSITTGNAGDAAAAAATLAVLQPTTATKQFAPATAGAGNVSRLSVTLTNPNAVEVTGADFTDTYPAGLLNTSTPGASTTCVGGVVVALAGGNSFDLSSAKIPAGGSCTVSVNVSAAATGSYLNTTGLISTTNASNAAAASATLTVTMPAPAVSKVFSPVQITVNGSSTLTVTLSNPNASAITAAAFTDSYPAGLVNATPPAASFTNCGTPSVGATAGGSSLSLSGATIPAGGVCTVSVNVTSAAAGGYTNTIAAVTSANAGTGGPASAPLVVVLPAPTATKGFNPAAIAPGAVSLQTITITNPSATTITGASFTDNYPPGLVNAPTPNATTTCSGGTVSAVAGGSSLALTGASLTGNNSCTVTVNVTSAAAGSYLNSTGQIASANATLGNAASATLTVSAPTLTKALAPAVIVTGQVSTLSFAIANGTGNPAQSGLGFTDTLPAGVTLSGTAVSPQCGGTVVYSGGNTITFSGGSLAAAATGCSVTTNVTGASAGTYTNNSSNITALSGSLSAAAASATLTVIPPAVLSKAFSTPTLVSGQSAGLNFTVTNGSGNPAQSALGFTDTLPAGLTLSGAATSPQCGGVVSYSGGNAITFSGGTLAAGVASCSISATVTSATPGSYTNNSSNITAVTGGLSTTGVSASLTVIAPAALTKAFSPASIAAFSNSTLNFTITNGAGNPAQSGLTFIDTLPAGLTFSGTPTSPQCGATVSYSSGNVVTVTGGTLAAGVASCTIATTVTSSTPGSYNNATSNITGVGGGMTTSGVNATLTVQAPSPALSKLFSPSTLVSGQTSTLSFTIANGTGNLAQSGLAFTDTLPAGLTLSGSATASQCGGTLVYDKVSNPNKINFTGGSLANGVASCTLVATVTSAAPGSYSNLSANISNLGGNLTAAGVSATLAVIAPTTLAKSFSPATIVNGKTSTVSFTISNGSGNPAQSGLGFTDALPANVTLSGSATASQCGGTLSYDTSASPHKIIFSGGSLAAGVSSCSIVATVTSAVNGSYTNASANLSAVTGGMVTTGVSATLVVIPPATLTKAFSPTTVGVSSPSTLNFTISNGSGNPAQSGLGFTDALPAGLSLFGTATASQCGGTLSYDTSGSPHRVVFAGGTLAAGAASCTVSASVASTVSGSYLNAAANVTATAGGLVNGVTNQTLTVVSSTLTKAFSPGSIGVGQSATLSFVIANGAGNPAQAGLGFTDTLPAGLTLTGAATSPQCGGTVSYIGTNVVSFTGGTLALGTASCSVTATVTAAAAGSYLNGSSNMTVASSALVNGVTGQTLTVQGSALTKAFTPATIVAGQTSSVSFTISNGAGNPSQAGLSFTDTLPAGVTLSGSALSPQCGGVVSYSGGNTVSLTGGTLAAGVASCSVTATVTAAAGGSFLNNSANISGLGGGLTAAGVNALLTVKPAPALTKAFSPSSIAAGFTSTVNFTITNGVGNPDQSGLSFTDTLPAGVTLNAAPAASQCGGTVTGTAGSNVITLSGGVLSAGTGSCTVSAVVISSVAGSYNNVSANISGLSGGLVAGGVNATLTVSTGNPNLTKNFSPAAIGVGLTSTLTFTVTNASGNPIQSGLGFKDTLRSGLSFSGAAVSPQCGGTVSYSGGNILTFSGGALPAGTASCTITTTVTSATAGSYLNNSSDISGLAGTLQAAGIGATLTVSGTTLTKAFGPAVMGVGQSSALAITLTNGSGNPSQSGLSFTDTLATGLTLSGTPTSPQCGGTVSYGGAGNNVVSFSGGSLTAGTPSCVVTVTVTSALAGPYSNGAGNMSGLSTGMTVSGSASLTVLNPPTVGKAFGSSPIGYNGVSRLTITLNNSNSTDITGVSFSDSFPNSPGPMVVAATANLVNNCGGTASTPGNNSLVLTGGTIPHGGLCTVQVDVSAGSPGTYTNNTGPVTTGNAGIGASAAAVLVVAVPSLTKAFGVASMVIGESATLTFTIANGAGNPAQATGFSFTDSFSSANLVVTAAAASQCGGTVSYSANSITLSNGTLAAASTGCTVSATVSSTVAASYSNGAAQIGALGGGLINAVTNQILTVNDLPNLTVLKTAFGQTSGAKAKPGQDIPFQITVTNTGGGKAWNVNVNDAMSPYTAFKLNTLSFADGAVSSGISMTGSTTSYSYDKGSTWTTTPPVDQGGGYNSAVTNWKIVFNPLVQMNGNNAYFTITYTSAVK